MDELLKARKLGSAAARRQKREERERVADEAEVRRRRKLLYGYSSSDDSSSDDDSNTFSPIIDDHGNENTAATSEDESSIPSATPKGAFSAEAFMFNVEESKSNGHYASRKGGIGAEHNLDPRLLSAPPSPAFIRDPNIVDTEDASSIDYYSDISTPEDEYNAPPSPGIPFTAQSVLYVNPFSKPSIVSIRQSLPPLQTSLPPSHLMGLPSTPISPPPRSAKRLSSAIALTAPEQFFRRNVSSPALVSSEGHKQTSEQDGMGPEPCRQGSGANDPHADYKIDRPDLRSAKKPSFTRPSTSHGEEKCQPSTSRMSVFTTHQRRTSIDSTDRPSSIASSHTESSSHSLPHPPRQRNSLFALKPNLKSSMDVLPSLPSPSFHGKLPRSNTQPVSPQDPSSTKSISRKKSFSGLRNRSESIGKALRSASSSVRGRGRFPVVPLLSESPPVPEIRADFKGFSSHTGIIAEDAPTTPITPTSPATGLGLKHLSSRMAVSLR